MTKQELYLFKITVKNSGTGTQLLYLLDRSSVISDVLTHHNDTILTQLVFTYILFEFWIRPGIVLKTGHKPPPVCPTRTTPTIIHYVKLFCVCVCLYKVGLYLPLCFVHSVKLVSLFWSSQQPVPEKLQIRVNRISMAAYEALHYDKDQLKEACECQAAKG